MNEGTKHKISNTVLTETPDEDDDSIFGVPVGKDLTKREVRVTLCSRFNCKGILERRNEIRIGSYSLAVKLFALTGKPPWSLFHCAVKSSGHGMICPVKLLLLIL